MADDSRPRLLREIAIGSTYQGSDGVDRIKTKDDGIMGMVLSAEDTRDPRFVGTSMQNSTLLKPGQAIRFQLMQWFVEHDPMAFRIAYGVSRDIFENWFAITDLDGKVIDKLNDEFQIMAEQLNLNTLYITALFHEKWGGYSIIVDWEKFDGIKPSQRFEVFHRNAIQIVYNRSSGDPEIYRVRVDMGDFDRWIDVPAEFATHIVTRPLFSKTIGLSMLSPVYQTLVDYWHLRYQSGQAFSRHGPGFLMATIKQGAKTKDITNANQIIDTLDERTGIVTTEAVDWDFIGSAGKALNPQLYADINVRALAAGSFIPKTIIEGSEQGSKLSSETDQTDFFKFVKGEQELVDNFIRRHIISSNILADGEWMITWNEASLDREDDEPDEDTPSDEEEVVIVENTPVKTEEVKTEDVS